MKLINYDYGFTPSDTSGTYYRGKIKISYQDFCKAVKHLMRCKYDYGVKKILKHDLQNTKKNVKDGFHVIIRVTATQKLVAKYNLKGYKRQNYFVHVVTPLI